MEKPLIKLSNDVARGYVNLDLPEIKVASTGQMCDVIEISGVRNKGSFTLTVRPRKTEDTDCEIIEQKKIENNETEMQ